MNKYKTYSKNLVIYIYYANLYPIWPPQRPKRGSFSNKISQKLLFVSIQNFTNVIITNWHVLIKGNFKQTIMGEIIYILLFFVIFPYLIIYSRPLIYHLGKLDQKKP